MQLCLKRFLFLFYFGVFSYRVLGLLWISISSSLVVLRRVFLELLEIRQVNESVMNVHARYLGKSYFLFHALDHAMF